jgi:hypothetical protein
MPVQNVATLPFGVLLGKTFIGGGLGMVMDLEVGLGTFFAAGW